LSGKHSMYALATVPHRIQIMTTEHWAVICPERDAPGLWQKWLKENCVAIGWPPSRYHLTGPTNKSSWRLARERALQIKPGDTVVPYILPYKFGTPGRVLSVEIADEQWKPTVKKGGYARNPDEPELGRRIQVEWLKSGPTPDKVALVPLRMRTNGGEVKQTIEPITSSRYARFKNIFGNPKNWKTYEVNSSGPNGASPHSLFVGDALYQQRAKEAFPILVRQAKAGQKIFYSTLADELGMPNPRNLNKVLGLIGRVIKELSAEWKQDVPPLTCLVVDKENGLPGEGIAWFLSDPERFKKMTRREQRQILEIELVKIFNYPKWDRVLRAFDLEPLETAPTIEALKAKARMGGGIGEGEDHARLKQHVASNPALLELTGYKQGETEYEFPTLDRMDVLFRRDNNWVGVEVKGLSSPDDDLLRGIFQCVKYEALIQAELKSTLTKGKTRVVLVTTRLLPPDLKRLANILGVEVLEGIKAAN
jgi:hypothetical protein